MLHAVRAAGGVDVIYPVPVVVAGGGGYGAFFTSGMAFGAFPVLHAGRAAGGINVVYPIPAVLDGIAGDEGVVIVPFYQTAALAGEIILRAGGAGGVRGFGLFVCDPGGEGVVAGGGGHGVFFTPGVADGAFLMLYAGRAAGGIDIVYPLPVVPAGGGFNAGELAAGAHADLITRVCAGARYGLGDLGVIVDMAGQHRYGDVCNVEAAERRKLGSGVQRDRLHRGKRQAFAGGKRRRDKQFGKNRRVAFERPGAEGPQTCRQIEVREAARAVEHVIVERFDAGFGEIEIFQRIHFRKGVLAEAGNGRRDLVIHAGA